MKPLSQVSVVIPTAQPRFLRDCLAGLSRQRDPRFEVIVVENGPEDPAVRPEVEAVTGIPTRYLYLREPGLNRARNKGCRAANYPLIALLDDDCVPARDWIGSIIHHHEQFPEAAVIGGQVKLQFLADPPTWLRGEFLGNLSRVDWGDETKALGDREFIVGANMSFRSEIFERVGGFIEDVGLQSRSAPQLANDETLFNREAARHGSTGILYAPGIIVRHQIPAHRLELEYHEQRRYGQGVSDIDLAIYERPRDPLSGYERFRQVVQYQQWHREEQVTAAQGLNKMDADRFRENLVQTRIAYLLGAQDRVLQRFVPGSLNAALSASELRPYRTGRRVVAGLLANGRSKYQLHSTLASLLYRERPRPLRMEIAFDRGILHARVAFLRGFRDELSGSRYPEIEPEKTVQFDQQSHESNTDPQV